MACLDGYTSPHSSTLREKNWNHSVYWSYMQIEKLIYGILVELDVLGEFGVLGVFYELGELV